MKKFIRKTLNFLIGLPFIYLVLYISYNLYFNSKNADNSLFIWGDSQTYQGIDLDILKHKTKRSIYSAAQHGAGLYDFLVFADKVPSNSDVLVAISKPAQLRKKERDRNRSGISIFALKELLNHNYSWLEIFQISTKNIKPSKHFSSVSYLYDYSDTIVLGNEPIESFEDIYRVEPSYLKDKQNLYLKGVEKLKSKNCKIYLIGFPYHKILKDVESNSPIKKQVVGLFKEMFNEANSSQIDTLILNTDKQVMHDLTHLNNYGAKQVSEFIVKCIKKQGSRTIFVKNGK